MRKLAILLIGFVIVLVMAGIRVTIAEEALFDTKSAAEHCEKGIELLKAKNYRAAIDELEEAVSIAPNAESYYYLGYAYYFRGRAGDEESRKKSIESFKEAYDLDPNFSPGSFKPAEAAEGKVGQREQAAGPSSAPSTTAATAEQSDAHEPESSEADGSQGLQPQ